MKVFIASDHRGFVKKNELAEKLSKNYEVVDLGPENLNPADDYPVFAERVARAVVEDPGSFGVLLCNSGEGMEIAANKVNGARAALVWQEHIARETRADNDSNIVVFASDEHGVEALHKMTEVFLDTKFSGAKRHKRRLHEIEQIEQEESND
ncbi:RpiB/LacA/LacB family sugar-phosphate isomerase [Candidatus Saccharibacteria bacterium]|nr:RpiB/LacA/LacB family sugar-phosphate isomerase [Candidatus Saccharibacteria bacterium]